MSPRAPAWHSLMFRCSIVVGLVFLLTMSKSESAPLMPVRTEQRGGATSGLGFASRSAAFRPFRVRTPERVPGTFRTEGNQRSCNLASPWRGCASQNRPLPVVREIAL